ncbi:membrane anchor subunit of succinate dehydrogenase, Sdh4 [Tilletia horrida]|uniref:Succinate dehydrogenase [ubiquinone] cytochrome b small subunit n=1 Tax=Tilletia horrida TaxID=155126 RepID=A0AAN6JS59_9BASI|nr:membrane anchor subunit of succinate dehydrogenase, Sdh4 [Tilletia horrida]KAK0547588.1 membrane anchor subunit of succinate dehydrogenase, Sdh4 [Tilletia horrida]KAK0562567.1 membrane anchor subunit of succinate dehydrogenase, Sdh4 [Tilletia horrida]
MALPSMTRGALLRASIARPAVFSAPARTAFHSSALAQLRSTRTEQAAVAGNATKSYIEGTVNEPTKFPPPSPSHGSYHWTLERSLSIGLVPLIAAGAVKHGASGILDGALALTLVVHSHIGFDACLQDYLHKRKYPIAGPIGAWVLRAATVGTLVGIYEFQTNDVGFTEVISKLWTA